MSFNIEDFGIVSGNMLAVSSNVGTAGWYIATVPDSLDAPEWVELITPDVDGRLRIIGKMAYQVVDDGDVFWVDALLCNSATVLDVDPFIVYIDPRTDEPAVESWANNFPTNEEGGTADSMPHAGRCAMWGDFLVLGDIIWKSDPDVAFSSNNSSRYAHGLWFSSPPKTDTWSPLDVVFTGQKSGENIIQGIFPIEPGLLVFTPNLVAILQGRSSSDDFIYRELRTGISDCGVNGVSMWESKGGVAWGNQYGELWFTNGESFQRLDEAIKIENLKSLTAFGEYLFASTDTDVHVFRLYEEAGGFTRLTGTNGFAKMLITDRFLLGIEARKPDGSFILDDEVFGELDSEYELWSADRLITAFDFKSEKRGVFNGSRLLSTIRSRPLPGFGHEVTFWHKFGIRAKGTGAVVKAISRPSADPLVRGYVTRLRGDLSRKFDYVFDAHGPSLEATYDIEFQGDATIEHMTIWEHSGRLDK